jgi:hypothetical protein
MEPDFRIEIEWPDMPARLKNAIFKTERDFKKGKKSMIACNIVTDDQFMDAEIKGVYLTPKEGKKVVKLMAKIEKKRAKKKAKKERKKAEREMAKKRSLRHWLSELIEYPWKGPFDGLDKTWPNKFDPSESDNRAK